MSDNVKVTLNPPPELTPTSPAPQPPGMIDAAKNGWDIVADSDGRQLALKELDALEEFDLCEVAGDKSSNSRYIMMMSLYAMVRAINGEPLAFPRKMPQMRRQIERIGTTGFAAVSLWRMKKAGISIDGEDDEEPSAEEKAKETAKNSVGTAG